MKGSEIFEASDDLSVELQKLIDLPLCDSSARVRISDVACSLSLEHWHSARSLLRAGLLPSAVVIHRAQFEALTRSAWVLFGASNEQVSKLTADLSLESEQAAKNMPQIAQMVKSLESNGPIQLYTALVRFKDNSWKALNSYAHAGIHPIRRHHDGYPMKLLHDVQRNANGLAVMSCMQAVVLGGKPQLQRNVLGVAAKYPMCMPPEL
ncbi:DUF6988 family protein [Marinobacter salarius]|jgi:hypothetical protein|uniref:DUF6988 family protein n=1 Tax=Marinobacter salarius TaxID=1420917 RepID=UPI0018F1AC8F|nr:hypothetical protein [Marinobacter salarius]MBJ7302785.1 hypothetical protein [Marinobacter salarius]HIO29547.1 hypothetical protein [Marinobacter salarius]